MARIEDPQTGPVHTDVQFEHSDVNAHNVVWTGIWILAGAWISGVLLYFFFAFLVHYRERAGSPPPVRAAATIQVPPEPRIQPSPRADLQQMRASEDGQLNSYGWVDRQKSIVRIPIDRAIAIVAAEGIRPQRAPENLKLYPPQAGTRQTGFEGKVLPEPR